MSMASIPHLSPSIFTKVPNAEPGRESTEIEIYGMQRIPTDGEEDEESPSKAAKADLPTSQIAGGVMPGSLGVGYPPQSPLGSMPSLYNPRMPGSPAGWQIPPRPQPWYPQHPNVSVPLPGQVELPQRPLFPVQTSGMSMASIPHLSPLIFSLFLLLLPALLACTNGFSEDVNLVHSEILKDEAVSRLIELGKVSDSEEFVERTFQSPASIRAGNLIRRWMEDAGLHTWVDQMGNVHGRYEGLNPREKALLIGSHLDTVIDAGVFDGALGIITALSALKVLKIRGMLGNLKRPVEVIAFSDEEGVRFQSTFLGSAAIAGVLPVATLNVHDKSGMTVQGALRMNSLDITEENLLQLKYDPESVYGYIEVHIEQGPVLENVGLPLGLVKGIAGQTRLKVTVKGTQGHAGTVPMAMRRDPMAGAAELIVLLESLCKQPDNYLSYDGQCSASQSLAGSLVCTVGEISTWPSASNVIPGQVTFTVDIRAMDDLGREAIIYEYSNRIHQICDKRSVLCLVEHKHDANAVACDPELSSKLKAAAYAAVKPLSSDEPDDMPVLMSGAGHDAMAMSHLTKVAMLFVRCRGGVSHSPAEHVTEDDVWAAGMAVLAFLESFM